MTSIRRIELDPDLAAEWKEAMKDIAKRQGTGATYKTTEKIIEAPGASRSAWIVTETIPEA